jgi:hypothetical protein
MSNIRMPDYDEVKGRVVVVAGRPRIGGKSVLAHKLLHQYEENDKLIAVELPVPDEDGEAGGVSWLRSAVEEASRANIIDWSLAAIIGAAKNSDVMSKSFNSALTQRKREVIIRIPWYDATVSSACDIIAFAKFARRLANSFFVCEYAYRKNGDLENLRNELDRARLDNVYFLMAPPLLAADAAQFVDSQLASSGLDFRGEVSAAARQALARLVSAGSEGLEADIDQFCCIMHKALARAEADGGWKCLTSYIIEEYEAYLKRRRAAGDDSHD